MFIDMLEHGFVQNQCGNRVEDDVGVGNGVAK
jgi:hypothetical protein